MSATATLELVDGTRIVVPDDPALITPYVLREQQDWFEDEIRFLRRHVRPGERAIDIGANYGVYTLALAKAVGPEGRVWAFEPAEATADLLARSLALNGFTQVVLQRSAMAARAGTAFLSREASPELNRLADAGAGEGEAVPATTLDEGLERFDWRDIDVVKIDAEGSEDDIVRGGRRFLARLSPLVLYEARRSTTFQPALVADFAALGYESYRLVPGLELLARFDPAGAVDPFLINLFALKPEAARRWEARGALVGAAIEPPRGQGGEHAQALALHARSRDAARPADERLGALAAAFTRLRNLMEVDPSPARASSLARVAQEYGERTLACVTLKQLCKALSAGAAPGGEEFLAPSARFDGHPRGGREGAWLLAAALEELERLCAFSSFFGDEGTLARLEAIAKLGQGSPEMARRLDLARRRFAA